ncbi:MAG TPA: ABC transporter permease [Pyrinomonadaceae bacterium]|nr:ABC transporter permease [Pyrinomonadaceae bacterium]
MESIIKDIRYGIRSLAKRPGFVFVAVVTLALGIGANTAMFSLLNTVLLRPLPVDHPEQIVSVSVRGKDDAMLAFSYPNYIDFRDRNEVLSSLLIYRFAPLSLSKDGNNQRIWSYEVSGNYFDTLGVRAVKGRTFSPEEDRTKLTHPVVVVSYSGWQKRFASDPDLVGKEILLNNHPFKVIGITPEEFRGTELIYTPDMFVPLSMLEWVEPGSKWIDNRDSKNWFAVGRLKPGVGRSEAEASLNILAQQLAKEYPNVNEGQSIILIPPGFIIPDLRNAVVSFAWVLMAAVVLVLFVACANLAGLLLARAMDRRKEIAIRLAMGANRWRLIRQLLTESVVLSVAGGVVGLLLALWLINLLLTFRPPLDFPLTVDISLDWRVMLFSFLISMLTGVVFGLAPALQSTRLALVPALKDTAAQGGGQSRNRLRGALVVVQLALSLVLLIGAGLVVGALQQLQTLNPGFNPNNAMTASMDVGLQGYDDAKGEQFYKQLVTRVEALPGVKSAAVTTFIPLSLNYSSNSVYVEGQTSERGANVPIAMVASVGPRYFETMGTPILAGREFTPEDKKDATKTAIINETFVRRLFPGLSSPAEAIGKRISFDSSTGPFVDVVGVARDGKYFNIAEEPRPFVWTPTTQNFWLNQILVVRTAGDPASVIGPVRSEVRALDPTLPLFDVKTMNEHMRLSLFPARVAASVLGLFGLVALILAVIGIYGVTSYSVSQRTREIGIRMALGADKRDVLRLILSSGAKLALIGVVIGLVVATVLTRLVTSLLFGITPAYTLTFVLISGVLTFAALLACYVPARRAAKTDPLVALRYE